MHGAFGAMVATISFYSQVRESLVDAASPAKPIFIVGSPRSGTSVLTWSLGQHSNILVQEESSWIGPLAVQLELAYRTGTARGLRSQLSALDVTKADFFTAFGRAIDSLIVNHCEKLEANLTTVGSGSPPSSAAEVLSARTWGSKFQIRRSTNDSKLRWVDGTPEYSYYIHPLRKLFPAARFIHLLRDVPSVVRSILNFETATGRPLVSTATAAYEYWYRTVRACLAAERAFGSDIVCRVCHADLAVHPEEVIRKLLAFLGEPFEVACLEPLETRINSSNVPADFELSMAEVDPAILEKVEQLNRELADPPTSPEPHRVAFAELEKQLEEQVNHARNRA